jgi:hypothetical protein
MYILITMMNLFIATTEEVLSGYSTHATPDGVNTRTPSPLPPLTEEEPPATPSDNTPSPSIIFTEKVLSGSTTPAGNTPSPLPPTTEVLSPSPKRKKMMSRVTRQNTKLGPWKKTIDPEYPLS